MLTNFLYNTIKNIDRAILCTAIYFVLAITAFGSSPIARMRASNQEGNFIEVWKDVLSADPWSLSYVLLYVVCMYGCFAFVTNIFSRKLLLVVNIVSTGMLVLVLFVTIAGNS